MSQHTCRVCGNSFEYTVNGVGYDRELCGSFCDGVQSGRQSQELRISQLETELSAVKEELERRIEDAMHYYLDTQDGTEECGRCGHNIRDEVHIRSSRRAGI